MRIGKDNTAYLHHMLDAIQALDAYAKKHSFEELLDSTWDQAAVMRHLEIIGEAAKNIDEDFRTNHPETPWRTIIGLRNVLVHDYADVDIQIVWDIITRNLKELQENIKKIMP